MAGPRARIAASLDVAEDGQHATLAVAARLSTGQVRAEIAGAWETTTQARAELPLLLARIKPRAFACYPAGPAAALEPVLAGLAAKYATRPVKPRAGEPAPWLPPNTQITATKVTQAFQGLANLTLSRHISQPRAP